MSLNPKVQELSLILMRKKAGTCPAEFVFGCFFRLTVGVGKTNSLRPLWLYDPVGFFC